MLSIQAWYDELPCDLKRPIDQVPKSFQRATLSLQLRYNYVLVLLTRPFLQQSPNANLRVTPTSKRMEKCCEDSNDASIALLRQMHTYDIFCRSLWLDFHLILCAGLVLLLRTLRRRGDSAMHGRIASFLPILQACSDSRIAAYACQTFEALLQDMSESALVGEASASDQADVAALSTPCIDEQSSNSNTLLGLDSEVPEQPSDFSEVTTEQPWDLLLTLNWPDFDLANLLDEGQMQLPVY